MKFNPVLVVTVAAFATGMAVKMPILAWLESLGTAFLKTRNLPLILLLPLAVIGLLERHGLREKAQSWIQQIKAATTGRLLLVYSGPSRRHSSGGPHQFRRASTNGQAFALAYGGSGF